MTWPIRALTVLGLLGSCSRASTTPNAELRDAAVDSPASEVADGATPKAAALFLASCGAALGEPTLALAADGSIRLLVGAHPDPATLQAVIQIVEPDGTTRARTGSLGPMKSPEKTTMSIVVHDDGSATAAWIEGVDFDAGVLAVRVDKDGKVLWQERLGAKNTISTSVTLAKTPEGGVLLGVLVIPAWYGEPDPSALLGLGLVELDANGQTLNRVALAQTDSETKARYQFFEEGYVYVESLHAARVTSAGSVWLLAKGDAGSIVPGVGVIRASRTGGPVGVFGVGSINQDDPVALLPGSSPDSVTAFGQFPYEYSPGVEGIETELIGVPAGPKLFDVPYPHSATFALVPPSLADVYDAARAGDQIAIAGAVEGPGTNTETELWRRAAALGVATGGAMQVSAFPARRGSNATAVVARADGSIVVSGMFGGALNVGERTLQSEPGRNACYIAAFESAASISEVAAVTPPVEQCKTESDACSACIAENVASGAAYGCFELDATCQGALVEALACACDAQDAAAYASCFALLPAYGSHGAAARDGYVSVCADACR